MSASCASQAPARSDCATQAWSGTCTLRSLTKVEDRELPIPYVVYEAVYTPQVNPQFPSYAPPDVRQRFGTPAQNEFALQDHVNAQKSVPCESPVAQGSCIPEGLTVHVTPFDPEHAPSAAPPHAKGCAAIEAASEQDRVNRSRDTKAVIPERVTFDADSAALSPDATSVANAVAKRMQADPTLECVGVVGQSAPGESPSLAEARAHAVKELLISLGVDRGRLLTIALNSSVYGAGAKPQEADPNQSPRRVSLSVLLKTEPAPAQ